ncbi:MAG TPA: 6-pyruvoyl tetrahydrobiopterin synthase family protein [Acidobacteriota bacterium]|nr:6-pyruvoyl tetrahydrobiopterin synthase family protein [Acidobacteriota bacterium]
MANVYLTRRAVFAASHRLHSSQLSQEENRRLFGKCNHPNGHGHNYVIEVTVKGAVDPDTGIVFNLTDLKAAIEKAVMEPMDHRNLNQDLPEFADLNPTAENIALVCWNRLQDLLPPGLLHEVLIRETENNFAVYRGE